MIDVSTDERAIPPAGRIGETEDLIGSVFVQDGKVREKICLHDAFGRQVPGHYNSYRFLLMLVTMLMLTLMLIQ